MFHDISKSVSKEEKTKPTFDQIMVVVDTFLFESVYMY